MTWFDKWLRIHIKALSTANESDQCAIAKKMAKELREKIRSGQCDMQCIEDVEDIIESDALCEKAKRILQDEVDKFERRPRKIKRQVADTTVDRGDVDSRNEFNVLKF